MDAKYSSQDFGKSGSDGIDADRIRSGAQRITSPGSSGIEDKRLRV